jgi:hypothetical protein
MLSYYRPEQALGLQEVEASRISRQSAHGSVKVFSPMSWLLLTPRRFYLVGNLTTEKYPNIISYSSDTQ